MKQRSGSELISAGAMVLCAVLMGFNYELFIFPNVFAPAGLNGLATMVQYLFHLNIGFFSLIVNVPLLFFAWRNVDRTFTLHTLLFILVFSGSALLLAQLDLSLFIYHTDTGTSAILGPVIAGIINGAIYSFVLRVNGSTGGTDVIAALIRKRRPEASLMWLIFALNAVVAAISYFVYHFQIEPVVLCLVYCYISSWVSDRMMKAGKRALKFEVITDRPNELAAQLMREMHHGVTVLPAEGMFSGGKKGLLICVVNRHQIVRFHEILGAFPGAFAYVSDVNETMGNFQKVAIHHKKDLSVPRGDARDEE